MRNFINFADEKHDADYYVGSQLIARTSVTSYSSPNGTPKRTFSPGALVGTIYSWITRDGFVWWELNDHTFVKHAPGVFDVDIAEKTASGKEHEETIKTLGEDDAVTEAVKNIGQGASDLVSGAGGALSGIGDTLSAIGKNLIWIIILIIIAWILINSQKK